MTRQNKKLILGFVIVFLVVGGFFAVIGVGKKMGVIPSSFLTPKPKVLGTKAEEVHNAAIVDSDGDGLVNIVEQQLGTDMNNADSDDDGFNDGQEVQSGHDPLQKPDGTKVAPVSSSLDPVNVNNGTNSVDDTNSASNSTNSTGSSGSGAVATNGTDDFSKDTDADGLTDGQEKLLGTDIKQKDTDHDGFSDTEEIVNGYDPLRK